jgi:hypothetical protein
MTTFCSGIEISEALLFESEGFIRLALYGAFSSEAAFHGRAQPRAVFSRGFAAETIAGPHETSTDLT